MTSPDISLQDRLLPELDRDLLMDLAQLVGVGHENPVSRNTLGATVPPVLRTGRTLRYVEAIVAGNYSHGWLREHIKADVGLRDIACQAMAIGSELLASHYANELLDGDQPRIKALGVLMKQQAEELRDIAVKPKRNTCWTDA